MQSVYGYDLIHIQLLTSSYTAQDAPCEYTELQWSVFYLRVQLHGLGPAQGLCGWPAVILHVGPAQGTKKSETLKPRHKGIAKTNLLMIALLMRTWERELCCWSAVETCKVNTKLPGSCQSLKGLVSLYLLIFPANACEFWVGREYKQPQV